MIFLVQQWKAWANPVGIWIFISEVFAFYPALPGSKPPLIEVSLYNHSKNLTITIK